MFLRNLGRKNPNSSLNTALMVTHMGLFFLDTRVLGTNLAAITILSSKKMRIRFIVFLEGAKLRSCEYSRVRIMR